MKKELFIPCECNGEVVSLQSWDDEDEIYLTVYKDYFESFSLWRRLVLAWKGKGIPIADVVLSKENFKKIQEWNPKKS